MTKLTDKEKKQIIAEYVDCQNFREVARLHNKSVNTIRNVVYADKDIEKKLTQKSNENTKDILTYMDEQSLRIQEVLNSLLAGIEKKAVKLTDKDSIKDLATAYGIILDKQYRSIELQRGTASNEQLSKVQELINKLDDEAKR